MPASLVRLLPYGLMLLLPVLVMHAKAGAEVAIGAIDLLFLLRAARRGEWAWLRRGWVRVGAAGWAWLVLCSLPGVGIGGWGSLAQAAGAGRFLLLVAALEEWLLAEAPWRRRLHRVLDASALWIGLNCLLQFWPGHSLTGFPRYYDGTLTGPFSRPRAGVNLSRLLFPTLLPPLMALLARRRWAATLAGAAAAMLGIVVMVLIGQRMPLLSTLFGLVVAGLMLRRLRPVVLACLIAGGAVLALSPVISPPTWYRLVTKFSHQIETFPDSDYGTIGWRAVVITAQHPLFGEGFDGFRNACPRPETFVGWWAQKEHRADGGALVACNIHPHNHWLQVATDSGLPGLALFTALVLLWMRDLLRGMRRPGERGVRDPLRVGLFVAVLLEFWPITSTLSLYATEQMGWVYLLLGYGLAEARACERTAAMSPEGSTPSA